MCHPKVPSDLHMARVHANSNTNANMHRCTYIMCTLHTEKDKMLAGGVLTPICLLIPLQSVLLHCHNTSFLSASILVHLSCYRTKSVQQSDHSLSMFS